MSAKEAETPSRPDFSAAVDDPIQYFGSTQIDQRCSPSVTSWVMAEVKVGSSNVRKVSLDCHGGVVTARDADSTQLIFQHRAQFIIRFARSTFQACTFAYLMRNKKNSRFYCYVFGGASDSHIQLLFQSIRHSIREAYTKISDAEEDGKDLGVMSDRNSLRRHSLVAETDSLESKYDVHYIGRLRVSGPHGNKTLVDEVLQTIRRRHSTQNNSLPKGKCPTANLFFKDCQFTVTSHFIKLVDKHTQAVYLHKSIASVSYCARGLSHQDYMAVICREATEGHLFCYVVHRPYPDSVSYVGPLNCMFVANQSTKIDVVHIKQ